MSVLKEKKIIFNLSSTRVVAAVTYFDEETNIPVVESTLEYFIELEKDFNLNDFRKETVKLIDKICLSFITQGFFDNDSIINDIVVFLSSPWIEYDNYTLFNESVVPFTIDEKYLEKFSLKDNEKDDSKQLLTSDMVSVKVNNYMIKTLDILNHKGQKIEVNFMDSHINKFNKHFIDGAIRTHFPLININFSPFLPTLFNQISKIYELRDDFTFIDMSSEITEFGVYQNDEIKYFIVLPFGKNIILDRIIEKKDSIYDRKKAESILNMYLDNRLMKEDSTFIETILEDELNNIKNILENNLGEKRFNELPYTTFALSSHSRTNKLLSKIDFLNDLIFIGKKQLDNFVYFRHQEDWDNFLAAEINFVYSR